MKNGNLFIGTCRIKRPRQLFPADQKKAVWMIHGHVHSPQEILQIIQFLLGEREIAQEAWPFVLDDVNNGFFKSIEEVDAWRAEFPAVFASATTIVVEISTVKLIEHAGMFGNITAASNLRKGSRTCDFIDLEPAIALAQGATTRKAGKDEFLAALARLDAMFGQRRVIYIPHFQSNNEATGEPLQERAQVREWVAQFAVQHGRQFWDQTEVSSTLGSLAYKDSSHYSDEGEAEQARLLARLLFDTAAPAALPIPAEPAALPPAEE